MNIAPRESSLNMINAAPKPVNYKGGNQGAATPSPHSSEHSWQQIYDGQSVSERGFLHYNEYPEVHRIPRMLWCLERVCSSIVLERGRGEESSIRGQSGLIEPIVRFLLVRSRSRGKLRARTPRTVVNWIGLFIHAAFTICFHMHTLLCLQGLPRPAPPP